MLSFDFQVKLNIGREGIGEVKGFEREGVRSLSVLKFERLRVWGLERV
jgi:hypothetical protein